MSNAFLKLNREIFCKKIYLLQLLPEFCQQYLELRWPTSAIRKFKYSTTKNKYQHKNIYFSTENMFQSKNIYFSTKIYISIQKYLFQYKKEFSKKYKHIPGVFATRRQKGSESFKMADSNGYSKRSNHLLS